MGEEGRPAACPSPPDRNDFLDGEALREKRVQRGQREELQVGRIGVDRLARQDAQPVPVAIGVGHGADEEPASGQDTPDLAEEHRRIRHVLERLACDDNIDAGVGERQLRGEVAPDRFHAEPLTAGVERRRVDVHRGHAIAAGVRLGQRAAAAAELQETLAGADPRGEQLGANPRRLVEPAGGAIAVAGAVVGRDPLAAFAAHRGREVAIRSLSTGAARLVSCYESPKVFTARPAMWRPIAIEAVAPGEGALRTCTASASAMMRKSSTIVPSGLTACARTPAPPRVTSSARRAGTSRCSAATNAALLSERYIS